MITGGGSESHEGTSVVPFPEYHSGVTEFHTQIGLWEIVVGEAGSVMCTRRQGLYRDIEEGVEPNIISHHQPCQRPNRRLKCNLSRRSTVKDVVETGYMRTCPVESAKSLLPTQSCPWDPFSTK
jgi:hypothetical protein